MSAERESSVQASSSSGGSRRVQARVALVLLQALREHDRPGEILIEENVSVTLPRRLGLSAVVDVQIRRLEQDARKNRRISGVELRDLIRLVTRRPDAETIFRQVGKSLTPALSLSWRRKLLPTRIAYALARRRLAKTVRRLFGETFIRTVGTPFQIEASVGPLLEVGSGGHPCLLVTGLAENILGGYRAGPQVVAHPSCRGRGDDRCLWILADPLPGEPPSALPGGTVPAGEDSGAVAGIGQSSPPSALPDLDPAGGSTPAALSVREAIQETLPGFPPVNS